MPSLKTLIAKIRNDYPALVIESGERAQFTPPNKLFYAPNTTPLELLHELGHYLTKHHSYNSDIELVRIESEAWEQAHDLCAKYQVKWDDDVAQDHLDTYRDWLHATSLCKNCNLAGYQDAAGLYHCALCGAKWPSRLRPEDY